MMAAPGVTRTPSGRIRRIPSDLMKRVRCAYPGCDLAVIPSNFARHWKFKHPDLPQPPIESLTVVRGDASSESGDVSWPHLFKNNNSASSGSGASSLSGSSAPEPLLKPLPQPSTTPHLRVDGKERKRARQRNYICPECQRPLIGSNFGRHWASKHPHLSQPSLVDLEMEALSGGEEEYAQGPPGPPSSSSSSSTTNTPLVDVSSISTTKQTVKKRKVVCRECEMPMINSNFSRHWASRHPHLDMPLLSELDVIDVEVDASPPLKKMAVRNPGQQHSHHHQLQHLPITIPYPEDEDSVEPADEDFEDVEEIEDDEEEEEEDLSPKSRHHNNNHHHHNPLEMDDYDEEELEEVTVEPVHYSNGNSSSHTSIVNSGTSVGGGGGSSMEKGPQFGFGGKRHKKVYCPECNMPMLCNNFRRHFHRRHGEMLHRMPSIHSLKLVPDEEYEMAQINKVVPPYNSIPLPPTSTSTTPAPLKEHHPSYPEVQQQQMHQHPLTSAPLSVVVNNNNSTSSPVRVKRKIVCSECGMAMIGSNFGRHWASKHSHLPQPALQDLVYADSAESGEAETVVCEPLFFGPDDLSEDDDEMDDGGHHMGGGGGGGEEGPPSVILEEDIYPCGVDSCSFSTSDKISLYQHRNKFGHYKSNGGPLPKHSSGKTAKKVWKKKVVCPECDLQTITSNFSRHWMAKHGHLPTPGLRDLQVITIDDPGFQGSKDVAPLLEAEEIVVDPTISGMNHHAVYEDDEEGEEEDYEEEDFDIAEDQVECVQEIDEDGSPLHSSSVHPEFVEEGRRLLVKEGDDEIEEDEEEFEEEEDFEEEDEEEEIKSDPLDIEEDNTPVKYSNNKINCNFDINSLLEGDDEDADDQDESGEFASVEVN